MASLVYISFCLQFRRSPTCILVILNSFSTSSLNWKNKTYLSSKTVKKPKRLLKNFGRPSSKHKNECKFLRCLVHARLSRRPSRSIDFGNVSERNGPGSHYPKMIAGPRRNIHIEAYNLVPRTFSLEVARPRN